MEIRKGWPDWEINYVYTAPDRKKDREVVNPNYQQGWVCPKCGRVNAPWVGTCPCYFGSKITVSYC